jgi:hypothetical protein
MADRRLVNQSYTVVASPAAAAETVIASVAGNTSLFAGQTFKLQGFCALTADASAVSLVLKIRRASLTGTTVATSATYTGIDILTPALVGFHVYGSDTILEQTNGIYVMTATLASAVAGSTVAAVFLEARVD